MMSPRRTAGATLIELIIAIVVIGSASVTLMGLMSSMAKQSADSMVSTQANSVASAYLREILDKPVVDPDIDGTELRSGYDNVDDYRRLPDTLVRDRLGNAVQGLDGYQVVVTIQNVSLNGIPSAESRRVDVRVTAPNGDVTALSGFRATQ